MVNVRMLTGMAGPLEDRRPGDVVTVSAAEAQRLLAAGFAEPAGDDVEIATAGDARRRAVARG